MIPRIFGVVTTHIALIMFASVFAYAQPPAAARLPSQSDEDPKQEFRVWTDKNGLKAEFAYLGVRERLVFFRRKDGRMISVLLDNLSSADQTDVKQLAGDDLVIPSRVENPPNPTSTVPRIADSSAVGRSSSGRLRQDVQLAQPFAKFPHPSFVNQIYFSPDSKLLATQHSNKQTFASNIPGMRDQPGYVEPTNIKFWSLESLKEIASGVGRDNEVISNKLAISSDARWYAVVGSAEKSDSVFIRYLETQEDRIELADLHWSARVAFSPDGKWFVIWDKLAVHVFEMQGLLKQTRLALNKALVTLPTRTQVKSVHFSQSGDLITLYESDTHGSIWTLSAKPRQSTFIRNSPGRLKSLSFSTDGNRFVVVTEKNNVSLYDGTTRRKIVSISDNRSEAQMSPDGKRVVLRTNSGIALWDLEPLRERWVVGGARVWAYSPDGENLATCDTSTVYLWKVETLLAHSQ